MKQSTIHEVLAALLGICIGAVEAAERMDVSIGTNNTMTLGWAAQPGGVYYVLAADTVNGSWADYHAVTAELDRADLQIPMTQSSQFFKLTTVKVTNLWFVDVNPSRPFEASQGTIPVGVTGGGVLQNKAGQPNNCTVQVEKVTDDSVKNYSMAANQGTNSTPTQMKFGTGYVYCERVTNAGVPWAYASRINKEEFAWTPQEAGNIDSPAADSFRSEVGGNGNLRFEPWGTELWCVGAIRFPAYFKLIDPAHQNWAVIFQMHDATAGLTGNPPFALQFNGGAGDPNASFIRVTLRRYARNFGTTARPTGTESAPLTQSSFNNWNPFQKARGASADAETWERQIYDVAQGSQTGWVKANTSAATYNSFPGEQWSGRVDNPAADAWHYFVIHYVLNCGPYRDPYLSTTNGGYVYGGVNESNWRRK